MSQLEYGNATVEARNTMVSCKLKLNSEGISYKIHKAAKSESIAADDIDVVNWQRLSTGYGFRIFTSKGDLHRFGGFKDTEQSKLVKFFSEVLNKTMTVKEFSVKGWNYGDAVFNGSSLSLLVGNSNKDPAFELSLSNVSGAQVAKNEVTLEFHQPDECPTNLMEMRFHIPPTELAGSDPVEEFQQKVMEKASLLTATGVTLAIFQEVNCLTPRGRYDIKMFPKFIQLHGKSFNFNIPIESVTKLFLLPHSDGNHHFFLVSVDPPIKQGQTRYPFLVMQFNSEKDEDIELPLSQEELQEQFKGRLEKIEHSGPQYEVVSKLFKGICGRKIVSPGENYISNYGAACVGCSYKATSGHLYPLERGFMFCYKPPIHVRNEDITHVNFARSGAGSTRSFDFEIKVKDMTYTFSSIEKAEYQKLYDFVKSKKIHIESGKLEGMGSRGTRDMDPDHYMNAIKADAPSDEDSDESTDEDFAPGEEGSDVAEEYDSDVPDSSDSDASGGSGSDSGSGSGSPKPKKPKPAKKPKEASDKPRKKRTPKGEKDENRPKRPQSAYFLWLNAHREEIKSDNPGISVTEISKKAGEMWRAITDKKEWEDQAAVEKEKYEKAMAEYVAAGGSAGAPKKAKALGGKKKAAPSTDSPAKGGSGTGFKSKEFLESDDSGSD